MMDTPADNGGEDIATSASNPTQEVAATLTESTGEETASPQEVPSTGQEENALVYTPIYKGKTYTVRADDRQEVTTLLQLGMKHREFLPTYERLARLAVDLGGRSVTAFIDNLCDRQEDILREQAVAAYGEEAGQRFYELERAERDRRYQSAQQGVCDELDRSKASREAMLAEQFVELQEWYPEFADFRDVPSDVVEQALDRGISLLDAHHRAVITAERYDREQRLSQQTAAAQTTGSLSFGGGETASPMDAFLTGLHMRT